MALYIFWNLVFQGEEDKQSTIYCLLNFFSWLSNLKYLRRLSGVRGFITLIIRAIRQMSYFLVIVGLFIAAFLTTLSIRANVHTGENHYGDLSYFQALLSQYRLLYADFGKWDAYREMDEPDTFDYFFFFATTFFLSLMLFNLIVAIFTDVYGDLKETKVAEDLRTLNEVLMDVEYVVSYLTCKSRWLMKGQGRAHLLWAEN